jgi:membrane protein YqaA with SNARE-associated domain
MAALPLPFDVVGLSAGITRYPVWRFLVYVALGKIVKVTYVATADGYGIAILAGIVG